MKGLMLAGGAGTRLRPITHTSAKQLVPVANRPILFYGIEAMAQAGIKQIGMIVGDTAAEVMAAVGDGSEWGVEVTYLRQDQPLGLAHCVLIAHDFLGDDDFVMYLGDNLLQQGLTGFVDRFAAEHSTLFQPELAGQSPTPAAAQILLTPVPDPQRFGVAELDEAGNVVRLVEKPSEPASDLALVGVYLFTPAIHEAVAAIKASPRGELEITDAIQWLIDAGHRVRTELLDGWWIDTGKLTPLLEANRLLLEDIEARVDGEVDEASSIDGRVVIEAGARIIGSRIRGPVAIAAGTVVQNSFIGPFTAVNRDCLIVNSEVEHSVIMEGCVIRDVARLEDSLLGREVEITRSQVRPRALRVMLGDHCQLDVE
ncbi:MAG: glucose-phosphate thymidylylransferase, long form [Acidimicrobiia bacterium]|nr:glucose-phosphate thymidylylransferase, long form [Acidimicrobiia bacterium]